MIVFTRTNDQTVEEKRLLLLRVMKRLQDMSKLATLENS